MIHPVDQECLQRMLGGKGLPERFTKEYRLWQTMKHREGSPGPLGPMLLIPLCRKLGLGPVLEEEPEKPVDWRKCPQDGSVRVEAMFHGQWMPGVFLGFVQAGTLAVRLDHDPYVKECRPHMTRLARVIEAEEPEDAGAVDEDDGPEPVKETVAPPPAAPRPPKRRAVTTTAEEDLSDYLKQRARSILGANPAAVAMTSATPVVTKGEVQDRARSVLKSGYDGPVVVTDELYSGDGPTASIQDGARVWVEIDGDIKDATAYGVEIDGKRCVRIDGEDSDRQVDAALVTAAS